MNNSTYVSNHFHLCAMWAGFKAYHMGTKEEAEAGYIPSHMRVDGSDDADLLPALYWVFGLGDGALADNNESTDTTVDLMAVTKFGRDNDGMYYSYAEACDKIGELSKAFMVLLRKGWSKMYPGSTMPVISVIGPARYKYYISGNANAGGNMVMRMSFNIHVDPVSELKISCPDAPSGLHEAFASLPNGLADLERIKLK
jgi:hypothetical protein